jgi:outer membrane receptor for monomeric catechols
LVTTTSTVALVTAATPFFLDPYDTWEGLVGYRTSRWSFQLNVYNLTDEVYARAAVSNLSVVPGPQRTFRFTTAYSF